MYKDLINKDVEVIVSSRGEMLLEYNGVLVDEDETSIKLKNVNISTAMLSFQKSMFGNMNTYKNDVSEVIVSKKFIVSCIVK